MLVYRGDEADKSVRPQNDLLYEYDVRLRGAGKEKMADLIRGVVAGMIGGVVGSGVKALAEKPFPPRPESKDSPPAVLAQKLEGHELSKREQEVAESTIHWVFGTLTGGVYGALAELEPKVKTGLGVPFGAALWLGTHETVVPALGLDAPPSRLPLRRQANELVTHLFYGLSLELIRRSVRARL